MEPNSLISEVWVLPQRGQLTSAGMSAWQACPGRADAVQAKALAGILTHPVGGPRRIQLQDDMYRLKTMLAHDRADLPADAPSPDSPNRSG